MLDRFRTELGDLDEVVDIRGKGLMIGIELSRDCADLVGQALERYLLINVTAGRTVRLLPPLIISEEEMHHIVDTVCLLIRKFVG